MPAFSAQALRVPEMERILRNLGLELGPSPPLNPKGPRNEAYKNQYLEVGHGERTPQAEAYARHLSFWGIQVFVPILILNLNVGALGINFHSHLKPKLCRFRYQFSFRSQANFGTVGIKFHPEHCFGDLEPPLC